MDDIKIILFNGYNKSLDKYCKMVLSNKALLINKEVYKACWHGSMSKSRKRLRYNTLETVKERKINLDWPGSFLDLDLGEMHSTESACIQGTNLGKSLPGKKQHKLFP